MLLNYLIVVSISALAVASVAWFFRKRRELILFLKNVTEVLEKYFKPVDKTYVWLGYLVGYRAKYDLPGNNKAYVLLTTVPRHSILYLPIAKLLKRRDRLEVAVEPYDRYVTTELHIHRKNSWTAEAVIRKTITGRAHQFGIREFQAGSYSYVAYYKDEKAFDAVRNLVENSSLPILYITAVPQENIVTASCEITLENIENFLELHRELVKTLTKPKKLT